MAGYLTDLADPVVSCAQIAAGILAPHYIIRFDVTHLDRRRWLRTWPPATHWTAVVVFGPFAVLVHFLRTRRSLLGAALGTLAAALAVLPGLALGLLLR